MKKHPHTDPVAASFTLAFPELFPRARALAQRILGDRTLAEDVAAEAMARAYSNWERIDRTRAYRDGWVLRVTSNLAIDVLRRQEVRRRALIELGSSPPRDEDDPALRLALVDAIGRLSRRQRESVVLRHLAGLTQAEVAAALGIGTGSVARHLHRGLAALRQVLGDTTKESTGMDGARMKVSSIEEAIAARESGEVLQARVIEALPGRMAVDIGIPATYRSRGQQRGPRPDPADLVGTDIPCVVTGVDRESGTVRTANAIPAEELDAFRRRARALAQLQPGDVRRGRVCSVVDFGVFVDVGEITGLVHISEFEEGAEALPVGAELQIEVLEKDPEVQRISFRPHADRSAVGA